MDTVWRFDEDNPFEDSFEETLISVVDSTAVLSMVRSKCFEIAKNPHASMSEVIGGQRVYLAKTGPVKTRNIDVPPLVILYTLDEERRLIQRLLIYRADRAPLAQEIVEMAINDASRSTPPKEPEILVPYVHTIIPKGRLRRAVIRAMSNAKRRPESKE